MARFEGPIKYKKKYDNRVHGDDSYGVPAGDKTINPYHKVRLVIPNDKGPTFFLPFNCLDENHPGSRLANGAVPDGEGTQTPWIVRVQIADHIGPDRDRSASFILYHPDDAADARRNPYTQFYYACNDAKSDSEFAGGGRWDSRWNILIDGNRKKKIWPCLRKPTGAWYIQGALIKHGDKNVVSAAHPVPAGLSAGDSLHVLKLTSMCGLGLTNLLKTKKAGSDTELAFKAVGDFDIKNKVTVGGRILHVFRVKNDSKLIEGVPSTWDGQIKEGQILGYEVFLRRKVKVDGLEFTGDLDAAAVKRVLDTWQPWFDSEINGKDVPGLLRIPSDEEQVVLIATAFQSVPKLVQYAFADHPDWLELDSVTTILKRKVSAVNPASIEDNNDDSDDDIDPDEQDVRRREAADEDEDEEETRPGNRRRFAPADDEDDVGEGDDVENESEDEDVEDTEDVEGSEDQEDDAEGDAGGEAEDDEETSAEDDEEANAGIADDESDQVADDDDEEVGDDVVTGEEDDEDNEAAESEDSEEEEEEEEEERRPAPSKKPAAGKPGNKPKSVGKLDLTDFGYEEDQVAPAKPKPADPAKKAGSGKPANKPKVEVGKVSDAKANEAAIRAATDKAKLRTQAAGAAVTKPGIKPVTKPVTSKGGSAKRRS